MNLTTALRSRSFWMLTAAFSLSNLSASAIRFHIIPFMIAAGFDASTAALASGSIGILQVTGRAIFAPLDSRVSNRVMTGSLFALEALALFVLLLGSSAWNVVVFILIFGASYGAKTLARPSMLAAYYGSSHFARISSIMAIFLTVTSTAAPVGASFVYDRFGAYQPVLIVIFCISVIAAGIMAMLRHQPIAGEGLRVG